MSDTRKSRGVLDVAKWMPNDVVYFVTCQSLSPPDIDIDNIWMIDGSVHPQVLYRRGILPNLGRQTPLPKLPAIEFDWVIGLLQSRLIVSEFVITSVERCQHTGECVYTSVDGEPMPESCLFGEFKSAESERIRILDLFNRWANGRSHY